MSERASPKGGDPLAEVADSVGLRQDAARQYARAAN
jgi:hypothetical protein